MPREAGISKTCTRCKEEKSRDDFFNFCHSPDGKQSHCKTCDNKKRKEFYERDKRTTRACFLKRKFGITIEEYERMAEEQDGLCYICRRPGGKKSLAVDHCHDTGQVRRLLCGNCNTGIGCFKENIELLDIAIKYLREWKEEAS